MPNIILRLNWVDIVTVIIVIRVCYVSIKTGFPIEIFKLLGTLCSVYLSLHYYLVFAGFLRGSIVAPAIPEVCFDFLCFIFLVFLGYFTFFLLRNLLFRFIKIDAVALLSKWGGLIAGLLRSILLIGLIVFTLSISTVEYLAGSANKSYIASRFSRVAPGTYSWIWNNITSKFIPNEKFNSSVLEAE